MVDSMHLAIEVVADRALARRNDGYTSGRDSQVGEFKRKSESCQGAARDFWRAMTDSGTRIFAHDAGHRNDVEPTRSRIGAPRLADLRVSRDVRFVDDDGDDERIESPVHVA